MRIQPRLSAWVAVTKLGSPLIIDLSQGDFEQGGFCFVLADGMVRISSVVILRILFRHRAHDERQLGWMQLPIELFTLQRRGCTSTATYRAANRSTGQLHQALAFGAIRIDALF
jgi:hypothetical protein